MEGETCPNSKRYRISDFRKGGYWKWKAFITHNLKGFKINFVQAVLRGKIGPLPDIVNTDTLHYSTANDLASSL